MGAKGETTVPKKGTTKRVSATKPVTAKSKLIAVAKPLLNAPKPTRVSIKKTSLPVAFVVPTPLPPPITPVIQLPAVKPPRAPIFWWAYFLMFLFAIVTLLIVGYVAIWHPFAAPVTPAATVPDNSAPSDTVQAPATNVDDSKPKTSSYTSVVNVPSQTDFFTTTSDECPNQNAPVPAFEKPTQVQGKTRLDLIISADIPADSTDETSFRTELARIDGLISTFAKHKFKATLYLTSPFVNLADKLNITEVAAWAKAGNEVAIAFDPSTFFGTGDQAELAEVPFGSWLLALHKQQVELEDLCRCTVTAWSGGGDYGRIYQAAKELDLTTNVEWDNGSADARTPLAVVNPWTPIQASSLQQLTSFDPFGSVVYVPNGVYPTQCDSTFSTKSPFMNERIDYITKSLYASLASASTDRVNVMRVAIGPDQFDSVDDETVLSGWNTWLTSVVDPYIRSGNIIPSTDSATSAAFIDWLDQNIGKIELKLLAKIVIS